MCAVSVTRLWVDLNTSASVPIFPPALPYVPFMKNARLEPCHAVHYQEGESFLGARERPPAIRNQHALDIIEQ